jgi:hypothetical protein
MSLNFPTSPSNNQIYFDSISGNRYKYNATNNVWFFVANNDIQGSSLDTQVVFNDGNSANGSVGLTFNKTANTLTANTINAFSMRVTGNLYIGSNTVVISNNSISAEMINVTTVMVAGSAIPSGTQSNAMYDLTNAAFGHTNTTLTHSQAVYAAVNSVFGVANASYTSSNAGYTVANAAFGSANSKVSKSGDTITGTLSIVGDLVVSGNTYQLNANTMSISDPLIYLAANNYSSDIVDIGFIANYVNTGGANVHTGLYREHTDKEYYLFQGYDREPINNHIGALSNNMTLSVLNADLRTSNLNLGGANAITWISSAFGKANTALQNTSGVLVGNLAVTGNVAVGTDTIPANSLFTIGGSLAGTVGSSFSSWNKSLTIGSPPGYNGPYMAGNTALLYVSNYSNDTGDNVYPIYCEDENNIVDFYLWSGNNASGTDKRAYFGGSVGIGTLPTQKLHVSGTGFASTDFRAPIFYDSDNTGFYVDAASTSVVNNLTINNSATLNTAIDQALTLNSTDSNWNYIGFAHSSTRKSYFGLDSAGNPVWGTDSAYLYTTGNYLLVGSSCRSPLFYDSDNTGYYVDPASNSNINTMSMAGDLSFGTNSGYGINLYGGSTGAHRIYLDTYWTIFKSHSNEGWKFRDNSNTDRVQIYGATGQIRIAANPSGWNAAPGLVVGYNGDGYIQTRHIWGKNASDTGNDLLYLNYASGYGVWMQGTVTVNGTATASADVRAPIFYDSDDTAYYANLAGASRLSGIQSTGRSGNWNTDFQNTPADSFRYGGDLNAGTNGPTSGTGWWIQQNFRHSNNSNFWGVQVAWGWEDRANELYTRNVTGGSYGSWIRYWNSANAPGTILQVQQTHWNGVATLATGSFANHPNLSVSITPKSTSSKILVMVSMQAVVYNLTMQARFTRNDTPIGIATAAGSRVLSTFGGLQTIGDGNHQFTPWNYQFLDSPGTTSALTYRIQLKMQSSTTAYLNRSVNDADNTDWAQRTTSSITVMEIAA